MLVRLIKIAILFLFTVQSAAFACDCSTPKKKKHHKPQHKQVKHYKPKPIYYSCPGVGYGTTLRYGQKYSGEWQVFHQGVAESISFAGYRQCNLIVVNASQYDFQCYFNYYDNVDGYKEASGLNATFNRILNTSRHCECVSNTTIKCY
jgi:hypothetical protein